MIDQHNWRAGLGTAVVAAVALWGLWQPESAAAASAGATLQYACTAGQPMTAQLMWNPPPEIVVGKPVPAITVTVAATIDATDARLLADAGVASIDGNGDTAVVVAPEGKVDATLHLVVSRTQVPASGPMTFHATGTLTGLLLRRPGHAAVDIGTALNLTLTPRGANGNPIAGAAAVSCTLNPGQSQQAFAFDVSPNLPASTTQAAAVPGGVGGSGLSTGGSSTAGPAASSAPVSTTPGSRPIRDSAAVSSGQRQPAGWWLAVAGALIVVAGAVGVVRWRRDRRRATHRIGWSRRSG